MIVILSTAGTRPAELQAGIALRIGEFRAPDIAVIDLGREPGHGRDLANCLRRALGDPKTTAIVLAVDAEADLDGAALTILAAEAWRKPVAVHAARRRGGAGTAALGNVVCLAARRGLRACATLDSLGIAVADTPAGAGAALRQALEHRSELWPKQSALLDFATAIRWVDRNVYC